MNLRRATDSLGLRQERRRLFPTESGLADHGQIVQDVPLLLAQRGDRRQAALDELTARRMKVESLMKWSGSQTQKKFHFKKNLKAALEELPKVGAIRSYRFEDELLHVERVPSQSQQRHLDRKAKTHR